MKTYTHFIWLLVLLLFSCKVPYKVVSDNATQYKIEIGASDTITDIEKLLKPYKDSLDITMNEVIGYAVSDFVKEKPSGSLGDLVADAMFERVKNQYPNLKAAVCNYGGIRIAEIKEGNITRGKIFELLPFENELVVLEIKGEVYEKWLNTIGETGGWPISFGTYVKGLSFVNNKFVDRIDTIQACEIPDGNGGYTSKVIYTEYEIQKDSIYYIATNDYVANGGDNCDFLKVCKRMNTGILIRDIMIDYIKREKKIQANDYRRMRFIKN